MPESRTSRREFLSRTVQGLAWASAAPFLFAEWPGIFDRPGNAWADDSFDYLKFKSPVARYWVSVASPGQCLSCHDASMLDGRAEHRHAQRTVKCLLCAQECVIAEGERGLCRARVNVEGKLRTLVYGRPITTHVDPIEKKPFYHFLPGSSAFSLATSGCPLRCQFCQNWQISQASPEDYASPVRLPDEIILSAQGRKAPVIAFTYNEPTVFLEYLTDIARLARTRSLRSVLISCGFMNEAPLTELCGVLDAIKIDLKGFSEDFYRSISRAALQPVLRSLRQIHRSGVHLEIVNLVIPTLNDSDDRLKDLSAWVIGELGPDVPIHFTRFHPDYQLLNLSPTPVATLERAREIAMEAGVRYAYVGNVPGHPGNHTYCPNCGKPVIERSNFFIQANHLDQGRCGFCRHPIAGVWA